MLLSASCVPAARYRRADTSGSLIRARKVRYYADPQLRTRVGSVRSSSPGPQGSDLWTDVIASAPPVAERGVDAGAGDGGLRRDPEPVFEEAPPPPAQVEFDWWGEADDDGGAGEDFSKRAGQVARQASLDPDDGVAL